MIEKVRRILINNIDEKSSIRVFLKSIYRKFPKKYRKTYLLQNILEKVVEFENFKFIQIGANDGVHCDPMYKYLLKKKLKALMVEPNPTVFDKLKYNHKGALSSIFYKKVAIGSEGEFTLFWNPNDTGVASTNKEHVLSHLNGKKGEILEEKIKMIPFDFLINEYPEFSNIDLLLIDTEGWDGKIILSINFKKFTTDVIVFENAHLKDEYYVVKQYLIENGYLLFDSNSDSIAFKRKPNNVSLLKIVENIEHYR